MNIEFFNILSEKLNVGSMRSIYLSAVPGRYRARMDLLELDKIQNDFSKKLFENLFSKDSFEMKIKMTNDEKNETVEKKLQYLYNEEINLTREEGISTFSLGYPIFVKQSKTKSVMKAPLFIWKLNIKRSKTDMSEYVISKEEDQDVEINKVLLMQLLSEDKVNLSSIFDDEVNEEGLITFENIKNVIKKINEKLPIDITGIEEFDIQKFPDTVEEINKKGIEGTYIFQGGILGLFKRQNEGIIQDFNTIKENFDKFRFSVDNRDDFQFIKTSSISTDPSQQNVIETLTNNQYKIIQGPPGTGKSQTLTAIITNSLENGANILIVCEKKTALDVIYEKISELGLEDLVAMISNASSDRKNIVKRVRDLEDSGLKVYSNKEFDEQKYNYAMEQFKEFKEKYKKHQELLVPLDEPIDKLLNSREYDKYYFVDTSKRDIKYIYKILDSINKVINKIGSMEKVKVFEKIYNEKFKNISSYETFFNETTNTLTEIKKVATFVEEGLKEYGSKFKEFYGANKLKISLFSIFNSELKKIKAKWDNINPNMNNIDNYNTKYINEKFSKSDYETYIKEINEFSNILSEIEENKQDFVNFLEDKKMSETTKEDMDFINNFNKYIEDNKIENKEEFLVSSYYYSLLQNSKLKSEKYNDYDVNINKLVEYDKIIRDNQKHRIKKYWSEIRNRAFKNLKNDGEDVKILYNLRKNAKYSKMNTLREVIEKNSNFFKNVFPVVMTDPNTCSALFPLVEGLFDIVLFDEASQLKLEEVLPALMRGKYKIVSGDMHQMPPSNYFGTEIDNSDIVNDENISEEDLFLADSESLLDYVNNLSNDNDMSYLDFHYRSKHPKLINFSNAAFYESRLVPMPVKTDYTPIEYYDINGVYGSRKNDTEADRIVEYIFSDKVIIDNKLMSVGIVTLNLEQKTNIVNKINDYLRKNDTEENKNRYNALMENNMFVKNLENVQGDERDIMILSTTFGKTAEGRFIQNFGPLNNASRGYKLLNVLITRAKYKFVVFSSIPQENINSWEEEITKNGNNGKGIFYSYLAYANAVSTKNIDMENIILDRLSQSKMENMNIPYEKMENENSKIVKVIKNNFSIAENEEIVKNYKIGGFTLDFAIKDKDNDRAKILIELNKTDNIYGDTATRAIIYRKGMFENLGYQYKLIDMASII